MDVCYEEKYRHEYRTWEDYNNGGYDSSHTLHYWDSLWIPDEYGSGYDDGNWSWEKIYYSCGYTSYPIETWEPFDETGDTGSTAWAPDCSDVWEDEWYLRSRHNFAWHRVGERSNFGNERNVNWEYRYQVQSEAVLGCKPLNVRAFEELVADWQEMGGGPACATVWEDQTYWYVYTERRIRLVGVRNDRDGITSSDDVTDTRGGVRPAWGCKPLNWQPFEQMLPDWHEVARAPAPGTVWEDQQFSQTATDQRTVRTGEISARGDERNVQTAVQTRLRTIEHVQGTRPLNWHFWENRMVSDWHDSGSWSPSLGGYYFWQDVVQSILRVRDWEEWEINDRGNSRRVRVFITSATFQRTVKGTNVPAVGAIQFDVSGGGTIWAGTAGGSLNMSNGTYVSASRILIPSSVVPGGAVVMRFGSSMGVALEDWFPLAPGGSMGLGNGITVTALAGFNATISFPDGSVVSIGPGGSGVSFPSGFGIRVATSGRIDVDLPPGTPSVVAKAVVTGGAILNSGAGHAISVRDAVSLVVGPLPSNPLLDLIDIGITTGGLVQLGLRQGNDGTTQWVPVHVNRLELNVVSRDKFLAGSIAIPQGMNNVELEFVNKTTGETLGRYGSLLGGGATKIYNAVPDILSDADIQSRNGDVESYASQNVWFVKDGTIARKVSFYTSFSAVGDVEVRVYQGVERIRVAAHRLVASADFGEWIAYVENWVNGVGFDFPGAPAPSSSFTYGYAAQTGVGASAQAKRSLARGSLIPIFNVVSQVMGMDPLVKGLLEGFVTGAKDDWETAKLIGQGLVVVAGWQHQQVQNLAIALRDQPLTRAREFMAVVTTTVQETVFKPLQQVAVELSTWEGFRQRAWPTWDQIKLGASKAWTVSGNLVAAISSGIRSWIDDFASRMIASADELTAYQTTAWYAGTVDPMEQEMRALQNVMTYSAGYYLGYLGEQALVGALTGGTLKIAQILIRGGTSAVGVQLIKRAGIAITTRLAVVKKTVQGAMASVQVRIAIESGLRKAAATPFSAQLRAPIIEIVESGFARTGFNRSALNLQKVLDRLAAPSTNLQRLATSPGREEQVWRGLAEYFIAVDNTATAASTKGWLEAHERLLKFNNGTFVEDRTTSLLPLWASDTTAEGRTALREALEGVGMRAAQQPTNPWVMGMYREMRGISKGEGHLLEAHHIAEERHLANWGIDPLSAPAVILAGQEHRGLTSVLLQRMPVGRTYSRQEVWPIYQEVYAEAPQWLDAIRHIFVP